MEQSIAQPINSKYNQKYFRNMTIEDLDQGMISVGSNHFYQIILVISFLFLKISSASYVTSLPFYLKEPKISCYNKAHGNFSLKCTPKEVCVKQLAWKNKKIKSQETLYKIEQNWKTFFTEYDILCSSFLISLFACTDSISYIISTLFSSLLADNIGRKKTILLNCFIELFFRIIVLFTKDKYFSFCCFLVFNLCGYINVNTINSYICEMTDKKRRGFYVLLTNSWSSLFGIVIALIFNNFNSWHYIHYSTILVNALGLITNLIFLKESVKFSFLNKHFNVLFETMKYMSVKNNREKEYLEWKQKFIIYDTDKNILNSLEKEQINYQKNNLSTISRLKSIFYNKENFYNFIILSAIMIVVGAAYAYNGLDMRNTKNMLVNPIIFFLTDFIVVVSAGALIEIPCIGRKKPVVIVSFLAAVFYIVKYLIIINNETNFSVFWVDLVLRFCININFYVLTVWTIEIYPFDISMLASNLNRLSSRIGRIYSPIVLLSNRTHITFQLIICLWISSFFLLFIKDTTGTIIKESSYPVTKGFTEFKLKENVNPNESLSEDFQESENLILSKKK